MNIVVVGLGKFGKALINLLSKENHNIIAIDNNKEVIKNVTDTYNVIGYLGNGASIDTLKEAGCSNADLVVAATGNDEVNILCCAVSKTIGVKYSIARVSNIDYNSQIDLMSNEFGISAFINAEDETAKEILRTICFPGAISVETFAKGRVDIAEVKLEEDDTLIINNSIKDIKNKYQLNALVCAVKRDEKVIIPYGDLVLLPGDDIYLASDSKELAKTFKILKLYKNKQNHVIIIGASEICASLVDLLDNSGIESVVVERDKVIATEFANNYSNTIVINDDGTNMSLLESEGLKNSAIVSLTGIDETNIAISSLALKAGAPKVITKVSNSVLDPLLDLVGLDSVVSPKDVFASIVLRYIRTISNKKPSEVKSLYKLCNDKVEALEFKVIGNTNYTNKEIKELKLKKNYLIAAIIRNAKVIMPSGTDSIKEDDRVIVVTTNEGTKDLSEIFD